LRRDELPPEVIALEGFSEILSNYYQEQKIGQMWRQAQPIYEREVERLHDPVSQVVFIATAYLREILEQSGQRTLQSSSSRWWGASPMCAILEITMRWC